MPDFPSSLLTGKNRAALLGEEEPTHPKKYAQRLRDRVYAGLRVDGPLLFERLDPQERRKIFRSWEKDWHDEELEDFSGQIIDPEQLWIEPPPKNPEDMEVFERGYLRQGISNWLAFLYLGIEEGNVGEFDEILEDALEKVAARNDQTLAEFDLTIEFEGLHISTPKTIAERVEEGDLDITQREVLGAVLMGDLEPDDAKKYYADAGLEGMVPESIEELATDNTEDEE